MGISVVPNSSLPKPLLFFPGDTRAITLWRLAAAFNAGDAATAAVLFTEDAEFEAEGVESSAQRVTQGVSAQKEGWSEDAKAGGVMAAAEPSIWKGPAAIETGLKEKLAEGRGMVRAELGSLKGTPVVIL